MYYIFQSYGGKQTNILKHFITIHFVIFLCFFSLPFHTVVFIHGVSLVDWVLNIGDSPKGHKDSHVDHSPFHRDCCSRVKPWERREIILSSKTGLEFTQAALL